MYWIEIFKYFHWLDLIENEKEMERCKCANGEYYEVR